MKDQLICTTEHAPGSHKLMHRGHVFLSVPTEVELAQAARKLGINFKDLEYKHAYGDDRHFATNWYGNKDQVTYLHWKGTLGAGMILKETIKRANALP